MNESHPRRQPLGPQLVEESSHALWLVQTVSGREEMTRIQAQGE